MALLHSLTAILLPSPTSTITPPLLPKLPPLNLHIVHFGHRQRNIERVLDRLFVPSLSDRYNFPFH